MFACSRAVVLLAACVLPIPRSAADPCPANATPFTLPSQITEAEEVKYSTLFSVQHYATYKVINFTDSLQFKMAWPVASMRGQPIPDMVLYKCGTERPTTGVSEDAMFFSVPIERVVVARSLELLHFLELLSVTEQIDVIDMAGISSPCQQLLEVCNPSIHGSIWDETWHESHEIAKDSMAVFTDSWGTGTTNSNGELTANTSRAVPFDMHFDVSGILQRAEWIRFVALFFNLEVEAGRIFARIEADYMALKDEAARLQGERASAAPLVAWVMCDRPSASRSTYYILSSPFFSDTTQEAGGRPLTVLNAGPNCTIENESWYSYKCIGTPEGAQHFRELLAGVDVIIDDTYVGNASYTWDDFIFNCGEDAGNFQASVPEAVYRTDWFRDEQIDAQPQQLLSDMMHAIWGSSFQGPCPYKYLQSLYDHQAPLDPLEHTDCPMYDPQGTHDCEAIHDYEHEVHRCALVTPSNSSESSTSSITSSITSSSTSSSQPEASSGNTMMVLAPCAFASVFCFHLLCYGRAA